MSYVGARAICGWCGEAFVISSSGQCDGCGGHTRLLEPLAVDCGWCGISNRRDQTADCVQCGGHLPALPGGNPGAAPPTAPRWLPRRYVNRIMIWKNVLVILGFVFTIPLLWTVVFPIVGIPMWIVGVRKGRAKLAALRLGHPTRGTMMRIAVDRSQTINDQHPWLLEYSYDTPKGSHTGRTHAWDPISLRRSPGDVLWVVYNAQVPEQNEIWPPIH